MDYGKEVDQVSAMKGDTLLITHNSDNGLFRITYWRIRRPHSRASRRHKRKKKIRPTGVTIIFQSLFSVIRSSVEVEVEEQFDIDIIQDKMSVSLVNVNEWH